MREANSKEDYELATQLIQEYASKLGVDLSFQNIQDELKNISTEYGRPTGTFILAYIDGHQLVGCAGIRKLEGDICELKRMYLRDEARGLGIGKSLLRASIKLGSELQYAKMRLDTLPSMQSAIGLYEKEGFYEIEAYRYNPVVGTRYYEIAI